MRRNYCFALLVFLLIFAFHSTIYAAPYSILHKRIGVLFLGDPSYRMTDFYNIAEDKLQERFPQLSVGDEIQSQYKKYYWNEKNAIKEADLPSRQELFAFLKTIPYDQVLVLVVSSPNMSTRNTFLWYFALNQSEAHIQIRALLVDVASEKILSDLVVAQKGPISINSDLSAKRGCFKSALEYFAANL